MDAVTDVGGLAAAMKSVFTGGLEREGLNSCSAANRARALARIQVKFFFILFQETPQCRERFPVTAFFSPAELAFIAGSGFSLVAAADCA